MNSVLSPRKREVDVPIPDKVIPDGFHLKTRILLAEDNFINQKVAVSLLNKIGYDRIDVVPNGLQAVHAIQKENVENQSNDPYKIILMDLQMPELSGLEATEEIRKRVTDDRNSPIIIALTANVQPDIQHKCSQVGFDDFLAKPFKLEQLQKLMHGYTTLLCK